eukprot:CAMPEP_0172514694 /NCGR_PEP_ID=MMETSP1066-20121228/262076_1 /TAXON_ID=671091 /ORGANISM="Coscinodiscus wailesii, Strain CCMP2513" /LENGTH=506 /DNA_ID=CAMNT_0013295467 /DNA_START=68 /DNA_END=1588 /DNA_ORIENTATION=-
MKRYIIALALTGIVDAISYMVVTPSLIFYVLENGGTNDQYGLIMSAFSFASFCAKPILGWWSDATKSFRIPYITSLVVSTLGGLVYLLASALPAGPAAVGAILAARLLGGVGAANSALGFAYIAHAVPQEEQTSVNSMLSMMRILGMALGPGVNVLVSGIDYDIGEWTLNSLNSVGLILIVSNIAAMVLIYTFLDEPDYAEDDDDEETAAKPQLSMQSSSFADSTFVIMRAFMSLDIIVPMLSIFAFNANFQLIETGFAPAANHALGWGPVQTSMALGSISFLIALNMYVVMKLSSNGISDPKLLGGGLVLSTVSYLSLYLCWVFGGSALQFYVPIAAGGCAFPFLAAPTRSIFTMAVGAKPALKMYQGSMQAVLSMAASVAGFLAPSLIAAYCLRTPEEVDASTDKRELTPWGLFAPVLSLVTLLGLVVITVFDKKTANDAKANGAGDMLKDDEVASRETSALLSKGRPSSDRSIRTGRRRSSMIVMRTGSMECMGVRYEGDDDI